MFYTLKNIILDQTLNSFFLINKEKVANYFTIPQGGGGGGGGERGCFSPLPLGFILPPLVMS